MKLPETKWLLNARVSFNPKGRRLIEELCVQVERPDKLYEHVWRVGDVLF